MDAAAFRTPERYFVLLNIKHDTFSVNTNPDKIQGNPLQIHHFSLFEK